MLHVAAITGAFCGSIVLGVGIGRLSGDKWILGFVIGAMVLLFIGLPRLAPGLINTGAYQALLANNLDAILLSVAGIIAVVPCLPKLRKVSTKCLVVAFLVISLVRSSVLPAACFYFNRDELANLSGRLDSSGIFLQTTDYTCGPAAAATVLKAYGIDDSEGNIALATRCNSYSGTRSLDIVNYINRNYSRELRAEYRYIKDLDELRNIDGFFITEVKAGNFTDHFVVIMGFKGDLVTVADPSLGTFRAKASAFSSEWRNKVIIISRI